MLYTEGAWHFANSGDGLFVKGTKYTGSNVPQNVQLQAGDTFYFASDGGHWNGYITVCLRT